MKTIGFHDHLVRSNVKGRKEFKDYLLSIFKKEGKSIEQVNFIFCSDPYLLHLNKKFLSHNYFTDTITFILSRKNDPLIGESYISIERIKENSKTLKISYSEELYRVLIHSTLHFCGYSDKRRTKRRAMESKQEKYLKNWIVSRETKHL